MLEQVRIKVRISKSTIWGSADPESGALDQFESEQMLCSNVEACIYNQYPDAKIDVMTDMRNYVNINGEDELSEEKQLAQIAHHVGLIVDKCWKGDWQVFAHGN